MGIPSRIQRALDRFLTVHSWSFPLSHALSLHIALSNADTFTRMTVLTTRIRVRTIALALALISGLLIGTTPAIADPLVGSNPLLTGGLVPEGLGDADAATYLGLFGSQGDAAPTGVVVSDSGFRPFPNGFTFVNYGDDQQGNQYLFGQPVPLAPGQRAVPSVGLDAASMRTVFGDGVCTSLTPSHSSGTCELSESAKVVMALADTWAASGHCFGLATVASGLFTGRIAPTSLRAGMINTLTTLNPDAQRTIMRAFIAQYFSARGIRPASMSDAISRLRAGIVPRALPFSLLLYGGPGGHALTPFAILDRGNGLFDIAVYDPNIPNQMRAVHVDTNANSWAYDGSTVAGSQMRTWSSTDATAPATMLLGVVDTALAKQDCPFCRASSNRTLVSFSPVVAANRAVYDDITVLDANGAPLDPSLYQLIPSTNDVNSSYANGPVLMVNSKIGFTIGLNGQSVRANEPFTVTVVRSGDTRSVSMQDLNPKLTGLVAIAPVGGALVFRGASLQRIEVTQTYEVSGTSYRFAGIQSTNSSDASLSMRTYGTKKRVIFRDTHNLDSTWSLRLRSSTKSSTSRFHTHELKLPKGDQLVVVYSTWRGAAGAPALWLDHGSDGHLDAELPLIKGW